MDPVHVGYAVGVSARPVCMPPATLAIRLNHQFDKSDRMYDARESQQRPAGLRAEFNKGLTGSQPEVRSDDEKFQKARSWSARGQEPAEMRVQACVVVDTSTSFTNDP